MSSPRIVAILLRPLKNRMIKNIQNQIEISGGKAFVGLEYTSIPPLGFIIKLNNKTPTNIKIEQITAWIYHQTLPIQKIVWSREEKILEKNDKNVISITEPEPVEKVEDLPRKGESIIRLQYTPFPSLYALGNNRWNITGFIKFSCSWGEFMKKFTVGYAIPKKPWDEAVNQTRSKFLLIPT